MTLALDSSAAIRRFGSEKAAFGSFLPPSLTSLVFLLCLLRFLLPFGLLLLLGFRISLARSNGGGVARDMTDQALLLRGGDYRLMQLLRQFCLSEFGEGARELRFVRQRLHCGPAAVLPQCLIDSQAAHQIARGRKIQNGFGHEGCRQRGAILSGSTG